MAPVQPTATASRAGSTGHPPTGTPWILHSLARWLPLSEQFVHSVVTTSRHPGMVVARKPLEHTDVFPHRPVHSLKWIPTSVGWATERRLVTASLRVLTALRPVGLVHHHHGYGATLATGIARRRRIPLVVSLHGQDVVPHGQVFPADYAEVFDTAHAVVVPSQFLVGPALSIGARADTVHVIPSGVDTAYFAPVPLPEGPPEVAFVGRFVEKKGLDVLLAAWPSVRAAVPGATLRLVGYGPLEALARRGDSGVVVEAADPSRRRAQVRQTLARARVVVTPSRTAADGDAETLLIVNLEAQALGRPLVTTRHGGIPEYVDEGRTALVVPENDADALADALVTLLVDDDAARAMADAGPPWAARFDVTLCTARLDDLYDTLMGQSR